MNETWKANEITIGYHPDGYRIDKTASPMNLYTRWKIDGDGRWHSPQPVDFGVFPEGGWIKAAGFDWGEDRQEQSREEKG